jgi:hypothetical protein
VAKPPQEAGPRQGGCHAHPAGAAPREWEKAWLDQPVAVLEFLSPRHSAASAAEGNIEEALRLENLLRQLEYQAGLAATRGERPIDTQWLRTELGLTNPLGGAS